MIIDGIEFKEIDGYEGYWIGADGRLASFRNGRHGLLKTPRFLKPQVNTHGYIHCVISSSIDGKVKSFRIHRLVALAFLKRTDGDCVNHINGNQLDNRVENLEWCSNTDNLRHHFRVLKRHNGNSHWRTKVSEEMMVRLKELLAAGKTQKEVAIQFGCHQSTLSLKLKKERSLSAIGP